MMLRLNTKIKAILIEQKTGAPQGTTIPALYATLVVMYILHQIRNA